MRCEPQASNGGCHIRNYRVATLILLTNIDGAYSVTMRQKTTATVESTTFGFVPITTFRAGGGGISFVLEDDLTTDSFPFVGDQESEPAVVPLVEFLVGSFAIVQVDTDVAHIADSERLHPSLKEGGDKGSGELVFDVPYLVLDLGELFPFGCDEPASTSGASFLRVDEAGEFGFDLVLVSTFGSEESSVVDDDFHTIEGGSRVDLPEVDTGYTVTFDPAGSFSDVGGTEFILATIPSHLHLLWNIPMPGDGERVITTAIGEDQHPITNTEVLPLPNDLEETMTTPRGSGCGICLSALSPRLQGSEESLNRCLGGLGIQIVSTEQLHHGVRRKPDSLFSHNTPEVDKSSGIEIPGRQSQLIHLARLTNPEFTHKVGLFHSFNILHICALINLKNPNVSSRKRFAFPTTKSNSSHG